MLPRRVHLAERRSGDEKFPTSVYPAEVHHSDVSSRNANPHRELNILCGLILMQRLLDSDTALRCQIDCRRQIVLSPQRQKCIASELDHIPTIIQDVINQLAEIIVEDF